MRWQEVATHTDGATEMPRHDVCNRGFVVPSSYVLPFRSSSNPSREFIEYVNRLAEVLEVVLVDGSPDAVFDAVDRDCGAMVWHLRPHAKFDRLRNGKVRGVLTGLLMASHELVILADDDVRYTEANLREVLHALQKADLVRPQNYFEPLSWHARVDTARTLINRMTGGDWPGTLAVRRSTLERTGGYDGNVLFENLELVRTVQSAGGVAICPLDLFIQRLPPSTQHYTSQRVRQAYDEFARPLRLVVALAGLPVLTLLIATGHFRWVLGLFVLAPIVIAEAGRRRDQGARVFPFSSALCAPLWVLERAICSWLALATRAVLGGIPYSGGVVTTAAHSTLALAQRQQRREHA